MTRTLLILSRTALALLVAISVSAAQATIVVYDLEVDYSDTNNPSGTWGYFKGNTPLTHFSTVSDPNLALAAANGYWGDTASSANSAFMKTTAFGSATGYWSNNDFWAGDLLVRTTDPNGPPMIFTWTAPSAGTFTYNGWIWYADAPSGPGGNSFTLSLNNGPTMEYGTAALGQDRTAATTMVNGLTPVNVLPGDVLSLQLDRLNIGPPFGSLTGISFTIDFVPAPEPGSLVLLAMGTLTLLVLRKR